MEKRPSPLTPTLGCGKNLLKKVVEYSLFLRPRTRFAGAAAVVNGERFPTAHIVAARKRTHYGCTMQSQLRSDARRHLSLA